MPSPIPYYPSPYPLQHLPQCLQKLLLQGTLCYHIVMQQPWPPQSGEGFRDLLPVKSPKVSVLEAESSYYDRSPGF